MRIDELGSYFGGEVPRAEGVGGGKPPPPRSSDTPDRGTADSQRLTQLVITEVGGFVDAFYK